MDDLNRINYQTLTQRKRFSRNISFK